MSTVTEIGQGYRISKGEAPKFNFAPDPSLSAADKNLTGATLSWVLRRTQAGDSGVAVLTKTIGSGIIVLSATDGTFEVTLTSANTSGLTAGFYDWEVWKTTSGSETRMAFGRIEIIRSIQYPG